MKIRDRLIRFFALKHRPSSEEVSESDKRQESQHRCLENCISQLPSESRDLIFRFYGADRSGKLDYKRALAKELGISQNSLRIRVYRIRVALQKCINECLEKDRGKP